MAAPKRKPFEIERDRAAITQSYLRGLTQANIAEQLGLSRQQIGYDLGKIQEGWRTQTALALDSHKAKELARLDELERIHWESWVESKQDKETLTVKTYGHGKGIGTESTLRKEGSVGNQSFLDGVLKVIHQRCKILGLEVLPAVIQQNLAINQDNRQVNTFQELTSEQLAEYASVIRRIAIAGLGEDDTAESDTLPAQPSNGHRESFKV